MEEKSIPNLFSLFPVEMYLCVLASTFGFTRRAMGATMPSSPATWLMKATSASLSALKE